MKIERLKNKIKENVYAIGYGLKYLELKDMDDITKMSLVEKNLISPEYAIHNENGAILINDEENICIMINDEDHLKIQVFSSGLELENTLNYAIELDQKIEEVLGYATSKKIWIFNKFANKLWYRLKSICNGAFTSTYNNEKYQ